MHKCAFILASLVLSGVGCDSRSAGVNHAAADEPAVTRTTAEPAAPPAASTGSTPWLVDLVWATAARLGYQKIFLDEPYTVGGDDHFSFIRRAIPGCDIIDFDIATTYWHTPEDTLDKVDPRSLAVVGHVFVETLPALEKKFR